MSIYMSLFVMVGTLLLASCSAADLAREPPTIVAMVEVPYCDVAARLADAGYISAAFDDMDNERIQVALDQLARDAGVSEPVGLPLRTTDSLWKKLESVAPLPSTLRACQEVAEPDSEFVASEKAKGRNGEQRPEPAFPGPAEQTERPRATTEAVGEIALPRPRPPRRIEPKPIDRRVEVGRAGMVIEELRCEGLAGAWLLIIEGEVIEASVDTVTVEAEKRYALRFWPNEEGVDEGDWFCAPRRRFCYSSVEFSSWQGEFSVGSTIERPAAKAFPAQLGIPLGTSGVIERQCGF